MNGRGHFWLQNAALYLMLTILTAAVLLIGWQMNRGRQAPGEQTAFIYLPTGDERAQELFTLTRNGATGTFAVSGSLLPRDFNGNPLTLVPPDVTTSVLLGAYVYDFRIRADDQETRFSWQLAGVKVGAGDEVGRAPAFYETGRLNYDPSRKFAGARRWPLWIDSFPTRALRMMDAGACGVPRPSACVAVAGGQGRVTLERGGTSSVLRTLETGAVVGLASTDRLWFGHVPLQVLAHDTGWLVLVDRSRVTNAKSVFLGDLVAEGNVVFPHGIPLAVRDVTQQLKGTALPRTWWSPEMEDEFQLLIDEELLCLELTDIGGAPHPQLVWKTPVNRGCRDYLAHHVGTAKPAIEPAIDERVLAVYDERRKEGSLVKQANEVLASALRVPRADALPFVFEWWPVSVNGRLELLPITLWGVRTQASRGPLWPDVRASAADPALIARHSDGTSRRLAVTDRYERVYVTGEGLAGLGPLLGHRGAIDGLDARPQRTAPGAGGDAELTIDLDLQTDLWNVLKQELASIADLPARRSSTWGVTAVAMDPENGDVLAVLNWPEALAFEDPAAAEQLREGAVGGRLRDSMNRAMLRDQDVGSTFKLMTMLAMAGAGILDSPPSPRLPAIYDRPFTGSFAVASTDGNGRVIPPGRAYVDGQSAPLPLGAAGMNHALDQATGASSNTFFAFAAMMLLSDDPPNVDFEASCPVDPVSLRRTDSGQREAWVICRSYSTLNSALGITQSEKGWNRTVISPLTTLLLLPRNADLGSMARAPFKAPTRQGFFKTAFNGGYSFLANVARKDREPGRALDVDGDRLTDYEGHPRWRKWFHELRLAEGSVFRYPALLSPGAFFAPVEERFGSRTLRSVPQGWRSFAQQAIGEGGQGSALSLATLYSTVLRDDGAFVAPRLLKDPAAAPELSPAYAGATPAITATRAARLRQAVAKPVWSGTARHLGPIARELKLPLLGKTGTFSLTQQVRLHEGETGEWLKRCGVVKWEKDLRPGDSPGWKSWLGSTLCEAAVPAATLIHRYQGSRPNAVQSTGERYPVEEEEFTSFVALIDPRAQQNTNSTNGAVPPGRPLTLAVISDIEGRRASSLVEKMLPALARWHERGR